MKHASDLDRVWLSCITNETKNLVKLAITGKVFCSNSSDVVSQLIYNNFYKLKVITGDSQLIFRELVI